MKISEAAKLLGISTDTIRYYEKEGVIYPKRISQNNYRDLDNKDVISLLACLYNRKIGYSMKESVEYVEGIPVSKVTDILNNKNHHLHRVGFLNQKSTILSSFRRKYVSVFK